MTLSLDAEKAIQNIWYLFMIKTFGKLRRQFVQLGKRQLCKT